MDGRKLHPELISRCKYKYQTKIYFQLAAISSVKLIRDKLKATPVGYGFVEFPNYEIAKNVYQNLNGTPIPGTQRSFKLNWASHGTKDSLERPQQQQPS